MYQYHFITMTKPTMKTQNMSTRDRIISFRKKYNMSREMFARFCSAYGERYGVKVTKYDIQNYERQKCCPKIDKLQAISDAIGFSVDYICGYGATDRKSKNDLVEARRPIVSANKVN